MALPLENVEIIAPMAQLARPPELPPPLEGILNLAGNAVPVLRLGRLMQIRVRDAGLYSMLIVLQGIPGRLALLVDRVTEILTIPESSLLIAGNTDSVAGCSEAAVSVGGQIIHLLCPRRILLEKERALIAEIQALEQRRLEAWGDAS
jgi:purine-binding chemotaxis protein CheW